MLQVVAARDKVAGKKIPLLVKIAPDLNMQQKEDIASVVSKKGASALLCLVLWHDKSPFTAVTVSVTLGVTEHIQSV